MRAIEDLLELDLPPTMATAPPNAVLFEVAKSGTGVAQYVLLSEPTTMSWMGQTNTLYWEVVCTCGFCVMLGMPCCHFWQVMHDDPFAAFHLELVHSQYFLEDPPMLEGYDLMSRNVIGKLHDKHGRAGPPPVVAPSVKGIVLEGEGDAASLVHQAELEKN